MLNPSPRARAGVVELVVPADGPAPDNVQVLSERTGLPGSMVLDANTVRTVLGMLQGPRISDDAWVHEVRIQDSDEGIDITIAVGAEEKPGVPIAEAKQDVYTRLGAQPDAVVRVSMDQPSTRRIAARTAEVPGYGWAAFEPAPLAHPAEASGDVLSNGLVRIEVDPTDGTFSVDGVAGYGRLVDGGDLGDSYNYSPPRQDSLVDTPEAVTVEVTERGPVRTRARVTATYVWPDHVDGGSQARVGEHRVEVETQLELRADEPVVRVQTSFVNPSGDHRLRVHLPLAPPAAHSHAESAFAVVTRGLTAEGRPDEFGLPTAPATRFVSAGRLTVAHEGVCEYELIDVEDGVAHTLALTVVRATGMLSRLGMAYRPFPAGPMTHVEGLQMVGSRVTLRYALGTGLPRPVRAGRRRPAPARGGLEPRRRHPAAHRADARGARCRGERVAPGRRGPGAARLQPVGERDDRLAPGPLGLARRPARLPGSALRERLRATPLRHRHRPAPRRLTGWTSDSRSPTPRSSSRSRSTSDRRPSGHCGGGRLRHPCHPPRGRVGRTTTAAPGPGS